MDNETKEKLFRMLKTVMAGYGKPAPDQEIFAAWIEFLKPYPLQLIRRSLADHCSSSEFAPVAAVIAKRCKELDGRPTADEAWAVALQSVDEAETVVWTTETAQAFYACKPVLIAGDKVGARMAFRDAYNRFVAEARTSRIPVKWDVSLGSDAQRRDVALMTAQAAGLITWKAGPALEGPDDVSEEKRQEASQKVRELLASLRSGQEKWDRQRALEIERQRQEIAQRKNDVARAVAAYITGGQELAT